MLFINKSRAIKDILLVFYGVFVVLVFFDYLSVIYLPIKWYIALIGSVLFFASYGLLVEYSASNINKINNLQQRIKRIENNFEIEDIAYGFKNKLETNDNQNIVSNNLIKSQDFNNSYIDTYK